MAKNTRIEISVESLHEVALNSIISGSNLNLKMLVFRGRKTRGPGEKPSEKGREPKTKLTKVN